ncbi:hypothetical protein ACWDKQ_28495 [Saccharopolyspora sp. NPDC000995]
MPKYFDIYFDDDGNPASTVTKIEQIIGLDFESIKEPYADYLAIRDPNSSHFVTFELSIRHDLGHDVDEDTGIPFKEMPRGLTVRGPRGDEKKHKQIAQEIFEKLKSCEYKPIYFVYDFDEVIEYWDPDKKGDPEMMEFWEPDQEDDHGNDA